MTTREQALKDRVAREDQERQMFGCTAAAIDEALATMSSREVAQYAMDTLWNAQSLIQPPHEGETTWSVADRDGNTIRQFINIAKYAIDKAVPR